MELLHFDANKDELVLKVNGRDFNQLTDLVSGVCSIYSKLDATILGMDAKRAGELCDNLNDVLVITNNLLLRHKNGN